jgi:hypothetical protein
MMASGVLTPLDHLSCYFTLNLYRCADALHECEVWVCHHVLEFLLHDFASPVPIQMVTGTLFDSASRRVVYPFTCPLGGARCTPLVQRVRLLGLGLGSS